MSVMGAVGCVTEDDVKWLRTHEVIWGDDVPEDPDDRSGEVLGGGDRLFYELGKASSGVHWLLTGGVNTGPLSFLENEALGEKTKHEFGYGPGRIFPPQFIGELKAAMDAIPDAVVAERLRDPALSKLYPFNIGNSGRPDDGDRAWLEGAFDQLSAFVHQAAGQQRWLLVAFY